MKRVLTRTDKKMPEIQFTMEGRSYSMTFEDDGRGNEFAIVTSDKGNTKRTFYC